MVGMFGGKAAKDGVLDEPAVKGNRKVELMGDVNGRIIDLKEEKVYELDLKKKTYEVTTFEELRRRMQEAREQAEKAQREAPKEERPQEEAGKPAARDRVRFRRQGDRAEEDDRRPRRARGHHDRHHARKGQDARRTPAASS